jgi:hypothetical protein
MMDVKRIGSKFFSFLFLFPKFFYASNNSASQFSVMRLVPLLRDILASKPELMHTITEEF